MIESQADKVTIPTSEFVKLTTDRDALYKVAFKIRSSAFVEMPIKLMQALIDAMTQAEKETP